MFKNRVLGKATKKQCLNKQCLKNSVIRKQCLISNKTVLLVNKTVFSYEEAAVLRSCHAVATSTQRRYSKHCFHLNTAPSGTSSKNNVLTMFKNCILKQCLGRHCLKCNKTLSSVDLSRSNASQIINWNHCQWTRLTRVTRHGKNH